MSKIQLNKTQKNFRKVMSKYEKKGLLPPNYNLRAKTVSFDSYDNDYKSEKSANIIIRIIRFIFKVIAFIFKTILTLLIVIALIKNAFDFLAPLIIATIESL